MCKNILNLPIMGLNEKNKTHVVTSKSVPEVPKSEINYFPEILITDRIFINRLTLTYIYDSGPKCTVAFSLLIDNYG